ncbi:hypothetical protein FE782_26585 [Paenibacillus antri]|uniref:Uncharacterized protein n=1 Tax=Paenibacillus antri TaxID=2582848 RepID=A0A5R9G4Y3_9BACL|nr:hypothetical protein [Paenibacillus antri]TLS49200.1 hypothetical protein FE782_26585 [Paenibacillus antri]
MPATPYARSISFGDAPLEDVALQYLPTQRQLVITFYYQGIQFACMCLKTDEELQPIRVVNHLKKDDHNMRARFLVSVLNDRLAELFRAISTASASFRSYVRREIGEISYA